MTRPAARRAAILISGRGSNMRALLDAARQPGFPARIEAVISNRPGAAGLAHAGEQGIATAVVDHTGYASREAFDAALDAELAARGIDLVCLAGFMRLLTPGFVGCWRGRMINIHPSLLPAFKGLDTHGRALAAGVRIHGASVHFVDVEMDGGPVIAQAAVAVAHDDTAETLAARVLEAEHRLYPAALDLVASGRARLDQGRVVLDAHPAVPRPLFWPAG